MKPETREHVAKASRCLVKARAELAVATNEPTVAEDAARNAYYAAFHAAQALIFERTGKTAKTHAGVHREFHRLARHEVTLPVQLRSFITTSYELKAKADYEASTADPVTLARATTSIATSERFVDAIVNLLPP